MKRGKQTYALDQMTTLTSDTVKQFGSLYLERLKIDAHYLEPINESNWDQYLCFEHLAKWVELFSSPAIQEKSILIVGDYDVDGIMASKIALFICEQSGVEVVDVYIPNRFTDGYGLNEAIVKRAIEDGFDLILTVDNGVSAYEAIDYARANGVEVLLTDHHHMKELVPDANLILHPDLGDVNEGINVCGTAVVYALARALFGNESDVLLPYVMLATLADSMPLYLLNRAFVKGGIAKWSLLSDSLLNALCLRLEVDKTDATSFAWKLIPVLNAIGRMGDVNDFADVLFWQDEATDTLVDQMIELNTIRKEETEKIIAEVMQMNLDSPVICAESSNWHQGVLGIAASRVVEMTQKPVLLFARQETLYKGSGRSPEHFHLFEFLEQHQSYIHAFGGHAQACGLTLVGEGYEQLKECCNEVDVKGPNEKRLDFDITQLDAKDFAALYKEIKRLAPFGNGVETPLFHVCTSDQQVRFLGKNREHLKLTLPNQMQLLFFNEKKQWHLTEQATIHTVGNLSLNYWQDTITYQVIVNDWWIDGIEFFYPNQVNEAQLEEEIVVIDSIPTSNEQFSVIKNDVRAKGLCLLKWQEAQKQIVSIDEDQIRMIYKYFLQKGEVLLNTGVYHLFSQQGIEKNNVNFAIKVFLELEFVIIDSGILKIQKQTTKRQLSDSNIYQMMRFQNRFVEHVVYASPKRRKELFEQLEELQ